ncbi:MAG TPA: hypothetical protein VGO07_04015 [Candidatus Saccharimonadales bacterium]|jgi:hypothetical protein|nr:hypothetical protein [Candidatus Saccharimonadales bacterium]
MSNHRLPIDLSTSRSKGTFEARFRVWGNHDEQTDGPIILADPEMPPARTLFKSERHGITARLNDMQPAASPGGAVVLTAEGPWQGFARVADLPPKRMGKIAVVAGMIAGHSEQVLGNPELLEQLGFSPDTTLAYAGSMNANAAVSSPHTNTVMAYGPATANSWKLATGTAPQELRVPLGADQLTIVENALIVPTETAAQIEAALDEIGGPEVIVGIAREQYLAHLATAAATAE